MNVIPKHSTAILVFAHSSQEELKHKKINKGTSLFDALTRNALKTVEETGIPFFHFNEEQQYGVSFGERFSNAIQKVFDKGYHRIITIGNDSPHLTKAHIVDAITSLDHSRLVIGPSTDGGFYLIGLHQKEFEKTKFEELSWQTSHIRQEVLELYSPADTEFFQLPQLFDIDTFADIMVVAKYASGLSKHILNAIGSIISSNEIIEIPLVTSPMGFYYRIPSNKGSPIHPFSQLHLNYLL